jgi:hypothetical protein
MLTIFAVPKPFVGHIGTIQNNSLASWMKLSPPCQVVLFGDELGVETAAREFRVTHIPDVARNKFGTPLLDDVFSKVKDLAHHRLLCYANADIVLFQGFVLAVKRVHFKKFLMTGRRWNLDIRERLNLQLMTGNVSWPRESMNMDPLTQYGRWTTSFFPRTQI